MKSKIKYAIYILLGLIVVSVIVDTIKIHNQKVINSLPNPKIQTGHYQIYQELTNNAKQIDWQRLNGTLDYINGQYDVADFHMTGLLRILYEYPDKIPADVKAKIKNTILNFRYWMDEPGENGMCYWSENHDILFATAEYLAGQFYPNEIFTNTGMTGKQHMAKAQKRILDWLEMRWKFGFIEFYSNVYYSEDIAPMTNLIDFCNNEEIVQKTKIIMDLLVYDIASQKVNDMFVSVSGRAYEGSRKGGPGLSSRQITKFIWGKERKPFPHLNYIFTQIKKYKVPGVLYDIGLDSSDVVIKQCNGLNISQLKKEGYYGDDTRSIMMQWAMEAFSDPAVVRNTLSYVRRNNMFSNEFLTKLKILDFTIARLLHLEPVLVSIINPQANGTAIQQANTYTYKTKDYSVYSVQDYFPGNYADQVHVAGMNIKDYFSVFHTHPAAAKNRDIHSPNYWVGYGRLPHVVQDSSISLSIYNLPEKKAMMEMSMLDFTHAYFPKEKFDTVIINKNYAFGKKGSTYCALIGRNDFHYEGNSTDDLIQPGRKTFWIIEAGDEMKNGSFENFCAGVLQNKVQFDEDNLVLTYQTKQKELKLKYCGDFSINGKKVNTYYPRFDSPYVKAKFKPDSIDFNYDGKFLHLDFYGMKREFN